MVLFSISNVCVLDLTFLHVLFYLSQQDIGAKIPFIMDSIKVDGVAEDFYRVLGAPREDFLRNFVEAQMMNLEGGQGSG